MDASTFITLGIAGFVGYFMLKDWIKAHIPRSIGGVEMRWPRMVREAHSSQLDDLNQRVERLEEFTEHINADLWNLDFNDRTGGRPSASDILTRLEQVEDALADDLRGTPVRDHPRPHADGVQLRSTASTGVPSTAASTASDITLDRYTKVTEMLRAGEYSQDEIASRVGVSKATVSRINKEVIQPMLEVSQ